MKSDLKAKHELHRYEQYYQCNLICELDLAAKNVALNCYSDFGPAAAWKNTRISHETYVAQTPAHKLSPFLIVPGFRIERHLFLLGVD